MVSNVPNNRTVKIGKHLVGPGLPVFVIAEAGVNHNGDLDLARKLIDVARDAGADAVKFQTFTAESLAIETAPKAGYQIETTGMGESQVEMLRKLELSEDAHRSLKNYSEELGLTFLSTPFDEAAADFLDALGVPAFKISSGDLTNTPLLDHVGRTGKPVIISTGMASLDEVHEAVNTITSAGNDDIVVLHCVSNYPAAYHDCNLRAISTMARELNRPVGYSDHTDGISISLAAVALGATVIEKHFTLDKTMRGPDHRASLEPAELKQLLQEIRAVEAALGNGVKEPSSSEVNTARVARRSVVALTDIEAGTVITRELLGLRRPGTGLAPSMLSTLPGKRARRHIAAGSLIEADMLE